MHDNVALNSDQNKYLGGTPGVLKRLTQTDKVTLDGAENKLKKLFHIQSEWDSYAVELPYNTYEENIIKLKLFLEKNNYNDYSKYSVEQIDAEIDRQKDIYTTAAKQVYKDPDENNKIKEELDKIIDNTDTVFVNKKGVKNTMNRDNSNDEIKNAIEKLTKENEELRKENEELRKNKKNKKQISSNIITVNKKQISSNIITVKNNERLIIEIKAKTALPKFKVNVLNDIIKAAADAQNNDGNLLIRLSHYFKGIEKGPTHNVNDKKQVDTKKPDDVVISAIINTIVDNANLEELAALKSIPVSDVDVNNSIKDSCNKFNIDLNVNTLDNIKAIHDKFNEKFRIKKEILTYEKKQIDLNGTTYNRVETGKRGHCMFSSVIFGMFYQNFKFPDSIEKNSGWNPPIDGFVKSEEKQHENCFAGNLRDVMAYYICKSTKVDDLLGNDNIRKKNILKRLIIDKPLSVSVDKDKYAQDDEIKILSNLLNTKIGVFREEDNTTGLVVYMPNGGVKIYYVDDYNKYHYETDVIYIYNTNDHFQYVYPNPNEAAIKFAARRNEETVIESVINTIVNPTNNRSSGSSSVNITGDNKLEMKQTQKTLDRLNKINEEIEELKKKKKDLKEERMGLDPTKDDTRIKEIDDELAEIKKAKEELVREQNLLNKIGIKNITWEELLAGISGSTLTGFGASAGITFGVGASAGAAAGAGVAAGALGALAGISAYKYYYKEKEEKKEEEKKEEEKKEEEKKEETKEEEKIRRSYEHTVNITHDVSTEPNSAGDHTRYSTVTVTDIPSATTAEQVEHALYNLLNDSKDSKRINETITFTPENSKVEENK